MNRRRLMMQGEVFRGLKIYTDADETSTFDPSWILSDASVMTVNWGDGTPEESHATALTHTYAAGSGRKIVRFSCPDWTKLANFDIHTDVCRSVIPSFARCTSMNTIHLDDNQFSGNLPSFAGCINLALFFGQTNQFSGTLPSFATNTLLTYINVSDNLFSGTLPNFTANTLSSEFYCQTNQFSGIIPSFAANTALTYWYGYSNQFSGYAAGGFATQKDLNRIWLHLGNNLTEAAVDAILADCVTSLSIPGRVVCQLFLNGAGNSAPSAAGVLNHNTLEAAGWTVNIN